MDKARKTAVTALMRMHQGGWANLTANSVFASPALSPRDRAFAGALFYGSAERLITLDYILAPYLKRPIEKMDGEIRAILETGLYQIRYMRVPPSAAVNEAVKLAKGMGKTSAAGLVNAVLRKAGKAELTQDGYASEQKRVEVLWSVSPAVAKAIMDSLPNEYEDFFASSFGTAELCLRVNTLRISPEELTNLLEKQGAAVRPGQLKETLYATMPGGVAGEPLFEQGLYHVQGEASQYTCKALDVGPEDCILDLCAAPGGKTATLVQEIYPAVIKGAEEKNRLTNLHAGAFTACELRENRLPLIPEILQRLGIHGVKVLQNDASVYRQELEGKTRILCDVPCSGLGVIAKKPDLRGTAGENFAALPRLQGQILENAARYLKKGGRLVYSTCTVRNEENAEVVNTFLQQREDFKLVLPKRLPDGAIIKDNMVTVLPHRTHLDGFFVASMERL